MAFVDIVTALALLQFLVFGFRVGQARTRYGIAAPAISGNLSFERYFRVQQNTLEQLIVLIPGLYLYSHYFNPAVAAGLGVQFAFESLHHSGRILALAAIALAMLFAVEAARDGKAPNAMWRNYRAACAWILASPQFGPDSTVMVRQHGVYAYLHRETVPMPIASLDQTVCYARANGVNAILDGPFEREHNPNIESPAEEIAQEKVFGEGPDRVAVLALAKPPSQAAH